MASVVQLLLLVALASLAAAKPSIRPMYSNNIEEDMELDTAGLLTKYGYPVEEHFVETGDGYLLRMFRVPYSPISDVGQQTKYPVLVMHGLMSSSADWVVNGPGDGFAYLLADAGYDVWLGNARGTKYSRNHTSLNPDESDFWQFSWHEIGQFDLPAMIDYILEQTGYENIYYAGHSQGTTSFYVMASERTDYNDKIKVMFSLAPVAYMSHMTSPVFVILAAFIDELALLTELIGLDEFQPNAEFVSMVADLMCSDGAFTQDICANMLFLFGGYNPAEMNETMLPVYLSHDPAGCSTRQLIHYGQEINSGHFRQYDYGVLGNTLQYGWLTPPDYDTSAITCKVALLYSNNDWFAALQDVDQLYDELPNVIGRFLVTEDTFSHLDFMWAIHGNELVFSKVISLMNTYLDQD